VPSAKCGVIIGKGIFKIKFYVQFVFLIFCCFLFILGGETIKQINMQTGAHCEIDRRHNNTGSEKTFVIRGTTEQIENAKRMINEKLGFVCTLFNIFLSSIFVFIYILLAGS